jgi:hypothetical protein
MAINTAVSGTAPRSKTIAIVLAVGLNFLTWLYTYKRDAWKFWVGLGIGLLTMGTPLIIGLWVWAVVDTSMKDANFYRAYPGGSAKPLAR